MQLFSVNVKMLMHTRKVPYHTRLTLVGFGGVTIVEGFMVS